MAYSLFRNVGLKFLSICIAALLWLVVAGDRVVERVLRVPIEFQNLPQGLEIVGEPQETVDVRLRGSSGTLGRLVPGDTAAVIDLRNARPGRRLFHLTNAHVKVPYGVEVTQITPATLPIAFENSAVRVVAVRPSIEGRPAPGYEVGNVTSNPSTVEVIGPESSLRGLDEAMTEPISVANATRPLREVVTIGVADPGVRLRTPQTASVIVQIVAGSFVRHVDGVGVGVANLDSTLRARVVPSTVHVVVRGTEDAVNRLTPAALGAQVDVSGRAAGDHRLDVRLRPPQGMTIDSIDPATVRVRLTKP